MRGRRGRRLSVLARRRVAAVGRVFITGLVLFMIAPPITAFAQDKQLPAASPCLACHAPDAKRPLRSPLAAAHADVDCADCHQALDTALPAPGAGGRPAPRADEARDAASREACPDPKPGPAVVCAECHEDAVKAAAGGSHHPKLSKWLAERGKTGESAACAACHGPDTHAMRGSKDPESPTHHARVAESCLTCHREVQPVEIGRFTDSVHGAGLKREGEKGGGGRKSAACTDCHGSHGIDHSSLPVSHVHRSRIAETCGECHTEARDAFNASVHAQAAAQGFLEAPVCTGCHGEHGIRDRQDPASRVAAGNVTKTCAGCHASEAMTTKFRLPADRVSTFQESFHGLSGRLGDVRVANCASCHGNHAVFPSGDPRSSIHAGNLARTCGTCHPGAGSRFVLERIHSAPAAPSHGLVGAVRTFYIALIVIVVGGMLAHNLLDLVCKAWRGVPAERAVLEGPLFTVHERVQHALLAGSFILLAVSGFALKFPDSPFAWPFQWAASGPEVRRQVHRIAGFAMLGLGVWHVLYLRYTVRGREQFARLRPSWQDARDAAAVCRCLVGRFTAPVRLPVFSYVEKAEYWALVWGTAIMGVTGLALFWHDALLSAFPVWVTDLVTAIHLWEAVLACLAIAVWHGYWVMFDPEVYPMNLTWLKGRPGARRDE